MKRITFSRLAVLMLAVAGLALQGCGGDDNGVRVETVTETVTETITETIEVPDDSGLEGVQQRAADAAAAAKMAADAAKMASDEAAMATMNLATMQTKAMAETHATAAAKYAKTAMDEYMKAKTASEAAAAATTTTAATTEKDKAEAAQMAAENAAMMVANEEMTGHADLAKAAAMMELMIDDTIKSVGDTTIDAASDSSSVTTGSGDDAMTVITGLIESENPMGTSGPIAGRDYTPAVEDNLATEVIEAAAPAMSYRQTAQARTFAIGKTLDSDDDTARLTIVTHYPGTNMVRVFAPGATGTDVTGTRPGFISIDVTATGDVTEMNNVALRSEGMFYPVSEPATAGTLVSGTSTDGAPTADYVAADAEPVAVFSYVNPNTNARTYATLTMTSTDVSTGVTTYTYNAGADLTAANAAPDGPDGNPDLDEMQVAVPIPGPVAYEHLHFGVWTELGDANAAGAQEVSGLGIGFLQSIGDGMTGSDMPNAGTATYSGNWVGIVLQGAGDDSAALEGGAANLTANLDTSTLTAALVGLATLRGAIDGSSFMGSTATVAANNTYGLTPGADFEGEFSGGFYGPAAAEAGGIFDFNGGNNGAFRGAFGGSMDE